MKGLTPNSYYVLGENILCLKKNIVCFKNFILCFYDKHSTFLVKYKKALFFKDAKR